MNQELVKPFAIIGCTNREVFKPLPFYLFIDNASQIVLIRGTKHIQYMVQLIQILQG